MDISWLAISFLGLDYSELISYPPRRYGNELILQLVALDDDPAVSILILPRDSPLRGRFYILFLD
jgi:hypothetical protein